ncbi:hypothetical protein [Gimesia fumaroli]|uniref:HEAT repeat domain-containing protein n=1 Tax=Gimesia fumaroli TaxID=2527976 RepID=A0A518IC08_9PLAN|nr:hypothetical protein [Gimesia fumaroli]QDV50631.1 hypothetical protein Enr17x_26720 [Gimesia fumaroli]
MKLIALCLLTLTLIGCSNSTPAAPEVSPGLTEAQLVPTLQKIAETGKYDDVLQDLTVGLENAGHMQQAVAVQSFQEISDPEDVKKQAAQVLETIKK